ncbi:MAG: PaaI family thioesterase [Myxococcota bacterium]
MDSVQHWVEDAPFARALGIRLDGAEEGSARLLLPFRDANANPGKALHGGCAASLAIVGAQAVARRALGEASAPWHTFGLQVNYLSAAIGEEVAAVARLLRRGKELCFVEVDVATAAGKPIAHATAAVRGRFGREPAPPARSDGDDGRVDPGPLGPHIVKTPFIAARGIGVELMAGGRSRLVMPWREDNGDDPSGVHEGAALALFDTTGAMAAWAETGPGPYKASTPSIQAQILGSLPREDLVGYGRVVQSDRELFWSEVEVAGRQGQLVARGTVIYRIVKPDSG